jgi:hypothetical protein
MQEQWQVLFDEGHQQRYLPDRAAVLRYVLGVAAQATSAGRARPTGCARSWKVIPEPPRGRIIPLVPGISRGTQDRRAALRAAVIQVVGHLVERAVPPAQRVPLFDQARDLLDEAGWGLDELVAAADPGPARDALLRTLSLQ